MSHHEMWRDEMMAWLLARDAATPWQVFSLIKYEGHPGLWYLLIWPFAHLSWNPAWMQALHALIAGAAVFVLLRYAPFSWPLRVVLALGYFLAYEWAVIARNYAVSVLLLFLFCAGYAVKISRRQQPDASVTPSGGPQAGIAGTNRRGQLAVALPATASMLFLLYAAGLQFVLVSCIVYAPATVLFVMVRREQQRRLFTHRELVILTVSVLGAVAGVIALASGQVHL